MFKISKFLIDKKVYLIILLVNIFALLYTLSNTYTDGYNLRQAQTAIMARNIFYDDFNFLPTRLTFFAPLKGNIIFEFPFLHFLTALTYKFFPISEINGRLINLFFYIFNGFLFYKTQQIIFKNRIAIITSSLFISSPLILYLAHAYMPETTMMTFYLSSYYFYFEYLNNKKNTYKISMFISLAMAPLLKPPAAIIYLPIFLDFFKRLDIKNFIKNSFLLFISFIPLCIWMIYAKLINSSELSSGSNYGDWINLLLGKDSVFRYWLSFSFYKNIISTRVIQFLNPFTFLISISALILNLKSQDHFIRFHRNWIISNLLFLFIFAGLNNGHPYYQIYFMPPLIFFIGVALSKNENFYLGKKIFINIAIFINLILSIAVFIYGANEKLRISNIDEFKSVLSKNITINKQNPSEYILYSHEGLASTAVYTYYSDSYSKQFKLKHDDVSTLEKEINSGAKYIFFLNTSYGDTLNLLKEKNHIYEWLNSNQRKLYESDSIILYELK